jgi:hypothetical protein
MTIKLSWQHCGRLGFSKVSILNRVGSILVPLLLSNWHYLCLNKIVNYQNVSRVKNKL